MKHRTDFVSNSSSCCYMFPLSNNHDESKWYKESLVVFNDTGRVQLEFDDFGETGTYRGLLDNWKFLCTQLIYWAVPDLIDGTNKTKRFVLRQLYNNPDFLKIQTAVIMHLEKMSVSCNGIELDEDEIITNEDGYNYLRPECRLDHESIFDGLSDLLERAKCNSVEEFIWGIDRISISWS